MIPVFHIERIIHVEVEGYCVYCVAETTRGTSEWEFSVDFDDNGHVTGNYDIRSENYESNIPEHFAKKIQRALMNKDIDNAFKKGVDDVKLAEAVNEHGRIQAKREATRTAERIEKERIALEMEKRQIELKDREKARTHRVIIFLIMLLVFLVVAGGIFIFFTERQHNKANEIHPPAYSSDFLEKNYEDVNERVTAHGVFTLQVPFPASTMRQCLKWMISARERLRKMETINLSVEEKMEEIRLVNRAKWILIEQLKMNEADAHRHIEKQAMDRCTTKKEIALSIIKTYT